MRRRSFFQRFAQFAAIVALAPQLAFRTQPVRLRIEQWNETDYEWEFFEKIVTMWEGTRSEKLIEVTRFGLRWEKLSVLALLCFSTANAQLIQVTCPTRSVPGTYTNQTSAGFVVQTVTIPVVDGTASHYYSTAITNLSNVFKAVPTECTIRTNYRQATLKILPPRAIRMR